MIKVTDYGTSAVVTVEGDIADIIREVTKIRSWIYDEWSRGNFHGISMSSPPPGSIELSSKYFRALFTNRDSLTYFLLSWDRDEVY